MKKTIFRTPATITSAEYLFQNAMNDAHRGECPEDYKRFAPGTNAPPVETSVRGKRPYVSLKSRDTGGEGRRHKRTVVIITTPGDRR